MPILISVYTERALDLGDLATRYSDIADIYFYGLYLGVQNNDWLSFRIDASDEGDAVLEEDYTQRVMRVRALVGRPVQALIESSNYESIDLALSRIPAAGVFVENEYEVIFSLAEIQRRLQSGEDWVSVGREFLLKP